MNTIHDALAYTQDQVQAQATIAEKYPATAMTALPGGQAEWTSPEMLDDANRVQLLGRPHIHVALTVNVGGIQVYHPKYLVLSELLQEFETKDPEGYQRLVRCFADSVRAKGG